MSRGCFHRLPMRPCPTWMVFWISSFIILMMGSRYHSAMGYDNGLALTPAMGWNSWNFFACDINQDLLHDMADALIVSGLADLGYTYLNLDDCWQKSRHEDSNKIQEDSVAFPDGIAALVDRFHGQGLKVGLYSDAGTYTCQGRPGSLGYEQVDAQQYAEWKIDYLKYDNCYSNPLTVKSRYQTMHDALNQTGHPIYFSLCEWGLADPATWARPIGNSWRTTGDIEATWTSMTRILDANNVWHMHAGPGGWNDPDMLEVGNGQLSVTESASHFTLWALIKAPLLLGNDIRQISSSILNIVNNYEVIAWNQDELGVQGYKMATFGRDGIKCSSYRRTVHSSLRNQHTQTFEWIYHSNDENDSTSDLCRLEGEDGGYVVDPFATNTPQLGFQARHGHGPIQVWAGPLTNQEYAIVIFNRSSDTVAAETFTLNLVDDLPDLQLDGNGAYPIRDVWAKQDLGIFSKTFTPIRDIAAHGVLSLHVKQAK